MAVGLVVADGSPHVERIRLFWDDHLLGLELCMFFQNFELFFESRLFFRVAIPSYYALVLRSLGPNSYRLRLLNSLFPHLADMHISLMLMVHSVVVLVYFRYSSHRKIEIFGELGPYFPLSFESFKKVLLGGSQRV